MSTMLDVKMIQGCWMPDDFTNLHPPMEINIFDSISTQENLSNSITLQTSPKCSKTVGGMRVIPESGVGPSRDPRRLASNIFKGVSNEACDKKPIKLSDEVDLSKRNIKAISNINRHQDSVLFPLRSRMRSETDLPSKKSVPVSQRLSLQLSQQNHTKVNDSMNVIDIKMNDSKNGIDIKMNDLTNRIDIKMNESMNGIFLRDGFVDDVYLLSDDQRNRPPDCAFMASTYRQGVSSLCVKDINEFGHLTTSLPTEGIVVNNKESLSYDIISDSKTDEDVFNLNHRKFSLGTHTVVEFLPTFDWITTDLDIICWNEVEKFREGIDDYMRHSLSDRCVDLEMRDSRTRTSSVFSEVNNLKSNGFSSVGTFHNNVNIPKLVVAGKKESLQINFCDKIAKSDSGCSNLKLASRDIPSDVGFVYEGHDSAVGSIVCLTTDILSECEQCLNVSCSSQCTLRLSYDQPADSSCDLLLCFTLLDNKIPPTVTDDHLSADNSSSLLSLDAVTVTTPVDVCSVIVSTVESLDVQNNSSSLDVQNNSSLLDVQNNSSSLGVQNNLSLLDVQNNSSSRDVQNNSSLLVAPNSSSSLNAENNSSHFCTNHSIHVLNAPDCCYKHEPMKHECFNNALQVVEDGCVLHPTTFPW